MVQDIAVSNILADRAAQPRAMVSHATITEYSERMQAGDDFPPLVVFFDGTDYWLADGFHRLRAAIDADRESVTCDVRDGGLREAILFSCGANASHGLPRSQQDKRRAVERLLQDEEWRSWSDRELARRAGVSSTFVAKVRSEFTPHTINVDSMSRTFNHPRSGAPAIMQTRKIGASVRAIDTIPTAETTLPKIDTGKDEVIAALRSIREASSRLPPSPDDAAKLFHTDPNRHFDVRKLIETASWLRRFGVAYTQRPKADRMN